MRVKTNMLDNRRLCAGGALSWRPPLLLEAENGRFPGCYHRRCLRSVSAPAPKVASRRDRATGGVSRPSSYIFDDSTLKNGVFFLFIDFLILYWPDTQAYYHFVYLRHPDKLILKSYVHTHFCIFSYSRVQGRPSPSFAPWVFFTNFPWEIFRSETCVGSGSASWVK